MQFKKTKETYDTMLEKVIGELKQALEGLEPPSIRDIKSKTSKREKKNKKGEVQNMGTNLDKIDVDYGQEVEVKEMDVEADEVKDRWSRYIGAMGIEAVRKQAQARVLLLGANALGIEVAKNIVLSGVKALTLQDHQNTSMKDLSGQFFL